MSDMPVQGLFQQLNARPVSGEHLEVLGKQAASLWSSGECGTLTEAVVATVKKASLSPEQVRRVIEFANTDAYLAEFKKEGTHKIIDFGKGGPADPSEILKDLNDGGGGTVFDRGTLDYDQPPVEKTGRIQEEGPLEELFGKEAAPIAYENPLGDALELRDKLAGADEHLLSEVSGLEVMYADLADRMYQQVKQAALSGLSLGRIMQAWQEVAPSEDHVKVAFQLLSPRLLREGVYPTAESMFASIDKVAAAGLLNREHPLVEEFTSYCEVLSKLAEARETREEVRQSLAQMTAFVKQAGIVGKAYGHASRASEAMADALATKGSLVHTGLSNAHNAALALGGSEALMHLKNSPGPIASTARGAGNLVLRNIPGTSQNLQRKWELQNGQ